MTESLKQILRAWLLRAQSPDQLALWFDPLRISEMGEDLIVVFPHAFFETWFIAKGKEIFETAVESIFGKKNIYYSLELIGGKFNPIITSRSKNDKDEYPFGAYFTFNNFLYNRKNTFPYHCAKEVAEKENNYATSNPFIVWGESGTGKTHLVRAMANTMWKQGKNIFFSSGSELKLECIRSGNTDFTRKALNADVLMIDGLDDLLTLNEIHEHILAIMDALTVRNKQMIFTVQRLPDTKQSSDSRLFNRLEQGLAVELLKPDLEIRMQHVSRRTSEKYIKLNKEQIFALVHSFTGFRQIDGVLNRLESFIHQQGLSKKNIPVKINQKDFDELLQYSASGIRQNLTSAAIIEATASHLSLSPADIIGDKRNQDVAKARQMAMLLCRELLHCSYPELGRIFGGKDHSTAMYSIKKAKQLLLDDKDTRIAYTYILRRCKERG